MSNSEKQEEIKSVDEPKPEKPTHLSDHKTCYMRGRGVIPVEDSSFFFSMSPMKVAKILAKGVNGWELAEDENTWLEMGVQTPYQVEPMLDTGSIEAGKTDKTRVKTRWRPTADMEQFHESLVRYRKDIHELSFVITDRRMLFYEEDPNDPMVEVCYNIMNDYALPNMASRCLAACYKIMEKDFKEGAKSKDPKVRERSKKYSKRPTPIYKDEHEEREVKRLNRLIDSYKNEKDFREIANVDKQIQKKELGGQFSI